MDTVILTEKDNKGFASTQIIILLLICVISFVLRFYFMQFREIIDTDGVYYTMLGENLFSGKGYIGPEGIYQWYYPPFFPVNIGLMGLFIEDIEAAGEWVSLVYGTLTPLVIFCIAYRIYNYETGIIAGFLSALFSKHVEFSSSATAESIFVFYTVLLAFLGYSSIIKNRLSWFFPLGLLTGILYLIKPAGIQSFGVVFLLLALGALFRKWHTTAILKGALFFIIGWSILSVPYLVYLHNHHGYWTLNELSTRNLYRSVLLSNNDNKEKEYRLTKDKKEMVYFTSSSYAGKHLGLMEVFKRDPEGFFYRYCRNFAIQIKRVFTYGHIWATGLLFMTILIFGLLKTRWNSMCILNTLFLGTLLLPFLTYPLFSSEAKRWLLPFIAILNVWYAKGIFDLQNGLRSWRRLSYINSNWCFFVKRYGVYFVFLFIIGYETANFLSRDTEIQQKYYPVEHKEMGLLMREKKVPGDTLIMSISPHTSFYAQTGLKVIPWGEYSDVIYYARNHDVHYLIIDETFIPRRRPQLAFLLNEGMTPSELKLVFKLRGKNGKKILAYKVKEEKV